MRLRAWRGAFALALAVVSYGLFAPPGAVGSPSIFPHADKVAHVLMFAALGALAVPAFPRRLTLAFALLAAYAVASELVQGALPGRSAQALDLVADAGGLGLGWLSWRARGRAADARRGGEGTRR